MENFFKYVNEEGFARDVESPYAVIYCKSNRWTALRVTVQRKRL